MNIVVDNLTRSEVAILLEEHLNDMRSFSPPESVHALDLSRLKKPEITFWTIWDDEILSGCGALKELDKFHGEIKSMRTANTHRKQGVASKMLAHIINEARNRGYRRLSLETGSMAFFKPAHNLYEKYGFVSCGPFADYTNDAHSRFYTKTL